MTDTRPPAILIVPDSFKGTLDADGVAASIASGFRRVYPHSTISVCPMADGGEGSSVIMGELLNADRIELEVAGPQGERVEGFYYRAQGAKCAYVELAAASGYGHVKDKPKAADKATTHGTGELIRHAIEHGATEVVLFLGGSATTDGGVGLAKALGFKFYDRAGVLMPNAGGWRGPGIYPGESLDEIDRMELGEAGELLSRTTVQAIVDVPNPLCGTKGAAAVYGPQKGADLDMVKQLDAALLHLAGVVKRDLNCDFSETPGAGAAGGAGFAVLSYLKGSLRPGAPFFLDAIGFDNRLGEVDLVITGEGKVDSQSIEGKLCKELLNRTERAGKTLLTICGKVDLHEDDYRRHPNLVAYGLEHPESMTRTAEILALRAEEIARAEAVRKLFNPHP